MCVSTYSLHVGPFALRSSFLFFIFVLNLVLHNIPPSNYRINRTLNTSIIYNPRFTKNMTPSHKHMDDYIIEGKKSIRTSMYLGQYLMEKENQRLNIWSLRISRGEGGGETTSRKSMSIKSSMVITALNLIHVHLASIIEIYILYNYSW